ncbi:hypothetical protein FRX31_015465 [Thalictrum thalictroides]|uniref:Transmembrane protein n=1 Tax=Thalictrum thalictroides TaxID=46969 RepID=A0A7J6WDJ6_THATH|nr:hypothetical protein FRX31_015465 [Thalictrum thalictroides]
MPVLQACNMRSAEDSEDESVYAQYPVLTYDESKADIPPLEVTFDEMEDSELVNIGGENQEHLIGATSPTEKNRRQEKKKAKDESYFTNIACMMLTIMLIYVFF